LFNVEIFAPADYVGTTVASEAEPSLLLTEEGLYMTWRTSNADGTYSIWVSLWRANESSFGDPVWFYPNSYSTRSMPQVFEYNETHIGVMYVHHYPIQVDRLRYHILDKDLTDGSSYWTTHSSTLDLPNVNTFDVQGFSLSQQSTHRATRLTTTSSLRWPTHRSASQVP